MVKIKTLADIARERAEKEKREKLIGDVTNPAVASRLEAKQARDTYEKWLDTSNANKGLENTDLTPAVPTVAAPSATPTTEWLKSTYTPYQGTATPTTDTGTGTNDYTKWTEGETAPAPAVTPTDDYSNWSGGEIPTDTEPKPETVVTEGEQKVEGELNGEGKVETEDSGFAKWLASDPTMQQRMKQAEADFYKNRAGYGVSGETLAQSGLVGSGWSSAMDAAAYSAMQAEKAGIRSEGYAKWLNEGGDTGGNGSISEAGSSLFNILLEEKITEFTDSEKAKYLALGWSQEAIDEADAAMKNYTRIAREEMVKNVSTIFDKFIADEDYDAFLSANGADLSNMTEGEKAPYFVSVVEAAVKEGLVTPEKASAAITKALIVEDDTTSVKIKDRVENAAGSIAIDEKIRGMISEEDYSRLVKSAYDSLGITKMYVDDSFGDLKAASTINIEVKNTKGKTETFKATALGAFSAKGLDDTLTGQFGNASLAFYGDSCYYQYEKGKWAKIKIDSTSYGNSALRSNLLRVVATYVGENGVSIPRS